MPKRSKDSKVIADDKAEHKEDAGLDIKELDLSSDDGEASDQEEEQDFPEDDSGDDQSEPESDEGDEEADGNEEASSEDEVGRVVLDLIQARGAQEGEPGGDGQPGEQQLDRQDRTADAEPAHDPGSDSSEDERPSRNTGAAVACLRLCIHISQADRPMHPYLPASREVHCQQCSAQDSSCSARPGSMHVACH